MLVVPSRTPVPGGLLPIASETLPVKVGAVLPNASRAMTCTGGAMVAPAAALAGCTVKASCVAAPAVMVNAALVAPVSPVALAVSV